MFPRAAIAVAVMAVSFNLALADQFLGNIVKVENGKITVATQYDKETNKFTKMTTYPVVVDVKVFQGKVIKNKIESGEPIRDALRNRIFRKLAASGLHVRVTTNDQGQVTEIHLLPRENEK